MKIRAHQLGDIMTSPKSKSEELSVTAKGVIRSNVKQEIFGYKNQINSKYIEKGITHEQDSIDLLNKVRLTDYTKHYGRIDYVQLSGECDILTDDTVIDLKTSWSLITWPGTPAEAHNKAYEWQLRAYMYLYERPKAELIFCMVSTDPELCKYEPEDIHQVDHIDPYMRITVVSYERDLDLEEQMRQRLDAAHAYADSYRAELLNSKMLNL